MTDFDQPANGADNIVTGFASEDEWWQRLQQMIIASGIMVFVASPDSAVCKTSSCDTFSTAFLMLDMKAFDAALGRTMAKMASTLGETGINAIAGWVLKGTHGNGKVSDAEMMVSAYASGMRMPLDGRGHEAQRGRDRTRRAQSPQSGGQDRRRPAAIAE